MPDTPHVKLDMSKFEALGRKLRTLASVAKDQDLVALFKRWGARYRSFAQRRFVRFSRGGGDWPPLAESTIKGRRKGKGKADASSLMRTKGGDLASAGGRFVILVNTGTLRNVLDVQLGRPGQLEQQVPFGVEVGYGGTSRYPGGKATIADIASFHQEGNARLPQRKIIVEPDQLTVDAMGEDALSLLTRILK